VTPASTQECFYEDQELNYKEQLDIGIRMLYPDICFSASELVNCHRGSYGFPDALGQPIATSLAGIRQWLYDNPRELVLFYIDNGLSSNTAKMVAAIEAAFGSGIVYTNDHLEGLQQDGQAQGPFAVSWPGVDESPIVDRLDPGNWTLGSLIEANMRFVYAGKDLDGGVFSNTYRSEFMETAQEIEDYVITLGKGEPGSLAVSEYIQKWDSMPPDGKYSSVALAAWATGVACHEELAQIANEVLFPPDTAAAEFTVPGQADDACGQCTCAGYRSQVEVAHQLLLDSGFHVGGVLVNYAKYGWLNQTVGRMNMANVRRLGVLPEPCEPANELPTGAALFAGRSGLLCNFIFVSLISVIFV
jgi:hypothetical protein